MRANVLEKIEEKRRKWKKGQGERKEWQYKEKKKPRFTKKSMRVAKQLSWGYPNENESRVEIGLRFP